MLDDGIETIKEESLRSPERGESNQNVHLDSKFSSSGIKLRKQVEPGSTGA